MRLIALAAAALLLAGILASYFFLRAPSAPPAPVAPAELSSTDDRQQFMEAVARDDVASAKEMLQRSSALAKLNDYEHGETPLHHAQSLDMAELLIEHGADAAARDRDSNATPARWAVAEWRTDVSKYLETIATPDDDIAYLAATGRSQRLNEHLTRSPEQVDFRTAPNDVLGSNRHLLHIASTYGQPEAARILLESGADACVDGGWNDTQPLENAAWAGYPEVVKLLIKHGADLEDTDNQNNHSALWYAAITGRTEVVKILLDAGAKIEDGMTTAVEESKTKSPTSAAICRPRANTTPSSPCFASAAAKTSGRSERNPSPAPANLPAAARSSSPAPPPNSFASSGSRGSAKALLASYPCFVHSLQGCGAFTVPMNGARPPISQMTFRSLTYRGGSPGLFATCPRKIGLPSVSRIFRSSRNPVCPSCLLVAITDSPPLARMLFTIVISRP